MERRLEARELRGSPGAGMTFLAVVLRAKCASGAESPGESPL